MTVFRSLLAKVSKDLVSFALEKDFKPLMNDAATKSFKAIKQQIGQLQFDFDMKISPNLQRLMDQNHKIAPDAIDHGLKQVADAAEGRVKQKVKDLGLVRRGKLYKSIHGEVRKKKAIIGTDHYVGHILENGAKPHTIKAKKAKSLYIPGASHPIKVVRHPGVRAYSYLKGPVRKMENSGEIESIFARAVKSAIDNI
jgi:hypothetical protein